MKQLLTLQVVAENRKTSKQPAEQILGARSDDFGVFWDNNEDSLTVARDALIAEFCLTQSFNKEELGYFILGMDAMYKLFHQASVDMKQREMLVTNKEV